MNAEQRELLEHLRDSSRQRSLSPAFSPQAQAANKDYADAVDAALKRIERLEKALKVGIAYMKQGDWSNGVTDYSGSIDQGETWAARDIEDCEFALESRD